MADKYHSFAELRASEPANAFRVVVQRAGGPLAIVAPHGGAIEPGTSEVSRAISGADMSLYLFEGTKSKLNSDLHITSTNFDEPECLKLLGEVQVAVTIHGEGGDNEVVYVGGRQLDVRQRISSRLQAAEFQVLQHQSSWLQGTDPGNTCNRCAGGQGVQLELSAGLRKQFFASLSTQGRTQPTERLTQFGEAVRSALLPLLDQHINP